MPMRRPLVLAGAAGLLLASLPAAATAAPARRVLRVDGRERTYLLHLPPAATGGAPRPLVLLLHGRLGNGAGMAKLTGFDALADREGIVVAYPDGVDRSWADGRDGTPADRKNVDDVTFLTALVAEIAAHARIDPARVYVAGMSNGGFMSERLACAAPRTFAAVGVVAATLGESLAARCKPAAAVPIAYVLGTRDPLVPYAGGVLPHDRGSVLGGEATVERWRDWNGCTAPPTPLDLPSRTADGTRVVERRWSGCRDGSAVLFYRVDGGGHAWPGGLPYLGEGLIGRTSQNLDASAALWAFFAEHRR